MKQQIFNFIWALRKKIATIVSIMVCPVYCINCGRQTNGIPVCKECIKKYLMVWESRDSRCLVCGRRLISEIEMCLECRQNLIFNNIDRVFPVHRYILWKKQLMFLWKSGHKRLLSPVFAKILYTVISQEFDGIPVIPVPPRPGKIRKKGWDQMAELVTILQYTYGVTVIRALRRIERKEQKQKNRGERLKSLGKSFVLSNNYKNRKIPEKVLIVDDVMTTGATLESCAQCLKKADVQKVYALTLFEVS